MTGFDAIFAGADTVLRTVFGETATYKALGAGGGTSITVMVTTGQPQLIVSDDHGQADDRLIFLSVKTSDVATPKRTDTYTLASTAYTGVWTHKDIERRDGNRWLISCRLMKHGEIGSAGAREVRA